MAIERIDQVRCIGCGACVKACPVDVIRMDREKKKAYVAYVEECMCCVSCELECPTGAIYVSPDKFEMPLVSWV